MIGLSVQGRDANALLDAIKRAESLGIPAVWTTSGGAAPDPLTVYAAASMVTDRVKLGTSIVPTWPRHPVALAQQAQALATLAPGRIRLGIGPSHQAGMERMMGVQWRTPLRHLREYLIVLKTLFTTGSVDFVGKHVTARAQVPQPIDMPVMASALRPASFATCGELADGAISWVCPWDYLKTVALPAIEEGAAKAGRQPPPLVAHVPICVHESIDEVRAAAREQLGRYGTIPFYQAMFATAGFPDAGSGMSDALIDALVVYGDETAVSQRLRQIIAEGAGEIIGYPVLAGTDRQGSLTRALNAIAAAQ